jgi:hypothetical protein
MSKAALAGITLAGLAGLLLIGRHMLFKGGGNIRKRN